jgi:uncharacterized protein (TIGR00290 family)
VLLSWSSGKDAAWALHMLHANPDVEVRALLTTINSKFERVAMHGVRRELVELQALAVGLPLVAVPLDWPCANEDYEAALMAALEHAKTDFQIDHVAFGDLYLEDVRAYRERQIEPTGLGCLFPIWGVPSERLAADIVRSGLQAWITCLDPNKLDRECAGRPFDANFLASLPDGVDACGENGEFHTFVSDGPMFNHAIDVRPGEVVERDGFVFADVRPLDCS